MELTFDWFTDDIKKYIFSFVYPGYYPSLVTVCKDWSRLLGGKKITYAHFFEALILDGRLNVERWNKLMNDHSRNVSLALGRRAKNKEQVMEIGEHVRLHKNFITIGGCETVNLPLLDSFKEEPTYMVLWPKVVRTTTVANLKLLLSRYKLKMTSSLITLSCAGRNPNFEVIDYLYTEKFPKVDILTCCARTNADYYKRYAKRKRIKQSHLYQAVTHDNVKCVEYIFEKLGIKEEVVEKILITVCKRGAAKCLKYLHEDLGFALSNDHFLLACTSLKALDYFFSIGFKPNRDCLRVAIEQESILTFKFLAKRVKLDKELFTIAEESESNIIFKYFIKKGYEPNNARFDELLTIHSAKRCFSEALKTLQKRGYTIPEDMFKKVVTFDDLTALICFGYTCPDAKQQIIAAFKRTTQNERTPIVLLMGGFGALLASRQYPVKIGALELV